MRRPKQISLPLRGIRASLEESFGFEIGVILRSAEDVRRLVDSDPFKDIDLTSDVSLYVTFLGGEPTSILKIPYESPQGDFRILQVSRTEALSIVTVEEGSGTRGALTILEKEFGKEITTRSWNVVTKIAASHLSAGAGA